MAIEKIVAGQPPTTAAIDTKGSDRVFLAGVPEGESLPPPWTLDSATGVWSRPAKPGERQRVTGLPEA